MDKFKLVDLCKIKSGGTPRRSRDEFFGGDIPWAKIGDISSSNGIIYETKEKITKEGLENINNRMFKKGTLLFSMYGSIGKVALAGQDMSTNQAILGINIKDPLKLSKEYLIHWFTYKKKELENETRGVTLKNLSATKVKNLDISLPPLQTQKKIATMLDKADSLRQKRRQTIDKLDELTQSVFLEMFGDPNINPKNWDEMKLKEIGTLKSGGTPSRSNEEYFTGEMNWFTAGELNEMLISESKEKITTEALEESSAKLFKTNSLLIGMYDTAAFKLSIIKNDSSANQACAGITLNKDKCLVEWLYYNLKLMRNNVLHHRRGIRQKNLSLGFIRDFSIPLPPISDQINFRSKQQKLFNLRAKATKQLLELNNLFNALLQKAFKGELQLSGRPDELVAR